MTIPPTEFVRVREPIRLGVIGLGVISQTVHLPNLGRLGGLFEVRHVCDLSAQLARTIAAETGPDTRHSTDSADLIADTELDAVLICTPGAHSTLARAALKAGKHVLAEKPYAYDPAVARDDATYAESQGLVLQVGYMKMYEPVWPQTYQALSKIEPVHLVRMTVLHPSDQRQLRGISIRSFMDQDNAAILTTIRRDHDEAERALVEHPHADPHMFRTVLHGSVCHQAAVLRTLFPAEVIAVSHAQREPEGARTEEPPKLGVLGTVGDRIQWSLSWNWLTDYPEYKEFVEVFGARGSVRIDFPAPYSPGRTAHMQTTSMTRHGIQTTSLNPNPPDAFEAELRAFAASLTRRAPVHADAWGAAKDADLLLQIARACR